MIHDRTGTGRPIASFTVADVPARIRVRESIRLRVRDEVARHDLTSATNIAFVKLVPLVGG